MRNLLGAFARNTVFANILLTMILFWGILAAVNLVREIFPEFSLDMITVTVVWPGADPEDVEEGICRKIEEAIDSLDGIKQYNSVSSENVGTVVVEVKENYDVAYVKDRVRSRVEAIPNFPLDAERPITEEMLIRTEVALVALYGEGMSEKLLKEWAETLKEEIRLLPGVSQVHVLGARDYEISIEVSEERLREYGLTFSQVARTVRASSLNLSGGTMRTQGEEIRLRTIGRKYTGKEFAEIVLLAGPKGEVITLDRIATIRDEFTEDPIISRFNGEPTISVAVLKTQEEDTLAIDRALRDFVAKKERELPEGLNISIWGGHADILQARISLLVRNGLIGLALVFILLWLFLDIRLSFWVGMGIPICIAGALAVMWGIGATLNMISLFGLIMVLGILVDDAVVVGEAIYVARKNGAPPLKAAIDGVTEVGLPIIAAVTTTIVAFLPLMFVGGIMGKFIAILPVVVIACLTFSLTECMFLLPAHLSHLPDPKRRFEGNHPFARFGKVFHAYTNQGLEWFVDRVYEPIILRALYWRYISLSLAIMVLMITQGLIQSGKIKFLVFPKLDGNEITATIEFPNGTPLDVTRQAVNRIENAIRTIAERTATLSGEPMIEHMYSLVGSTISDDRPQYGSHLGSVRIEMLDTERRNKHSDEIMLEWEREMGPVPGVVSLTFSGMQTGPPGAPIEVWIQGHNMDSILSAADELKEKLANYDGAYQIQHDFRPGKNEFKLRLKPEARTLGLTVADLAQQIYAGYFGEEAIRLQRGRDDLRVRVRYTADERKQVSEFERIRIRTPMGQEVPLFSVADIEFGPGYASINRTDGMRRVSVTAELDFARANPSEIFADLDASFFPDLRQRYPDVYIAMQGEQKKMRESLGSLFITYPLALLGIFVIIATIFRSYLQPLIIMITVPFGIIGAVAGHLALGFDLSMMSLFGMVALSGVVVNNAIVLIECINTMLSEGMPFIEAIQRGGARRFRAIFLTTITTVGGLAPLIMANDLQARFLIPMAISIAAGVAFATLLTLLLVPCLLVILNDLRRLFFRLRKGYWPTPEEVEPALQRKTRLLTDEYGEPAQGLVPAAVPE